MVLHGFGASAASWQAVLGGFGDAYSTYAYDRPAFGLTERPTEWDNLNPYSRAGAVAQLHALLDAWDLDNVILIGNSAGGAVAMEYALAHPQRVSHLILVSPAVGDGSGGRYSYLDLVVNTPQMQRLGR